MWDVSRVIISVLSSRILCIYAYVNLWTYMHVYQWIFILVKHRNKVCKMSCITNCTLYWFHWSWIAEAQHRENASRAPRSRKVALCNSCCEQIFCIFVRSFPRRSDSNWFRLVWLRVQFAAPSSSIIARTQSRRENSRLEKALLWMYCSDSGN